MVRLHANDRTRECLRLRIASQTQPSAVPMRGVNGEAPNHGARAVVRDT